MVAGVAILAGGACLLTALAIETQGADLVTFGAIPAGFTR